MAVDGDRLNELLGRVIGDLGATTTAGGVVVGHRLGLYGALARGGPATPEDLAARTDTDARYVAEWLAGQAAGGYVEYDPATGRFSMTPEQAFALADPDGPLYLPGAFVFALGALRAEPRITEAFRSGGGMGWHEHDDDVVLGCELLFRPGYVANLVADVDPGARRGRGRSSAAAARVADVGCGVGASSVLLAQAFPEVTVVGLGLPRRVRRAGPQAGRRRRGRRPRDLRGGVGADLRRHRLRPRRHLRQPARHGRPAGRRPAHPRRGRRRRHLDGGRASRGRPRRGQPQPGRPRLLRVLRVRLRAQRPLPARRLQPRGPGGRGRRAADRDRRRVHPFPPGGADAAEQRLRGTTVGEEGPCAHGSRTPSERSRRDGVRVGYEVFEPLDGARGRPTLVLLTSWAIVHMRQWKLQVPALARRFRVVTVEGRGNGAADRPRDPAAYADRELVADAVAVMDAVGRGPGGARRAVDGRAARAAARGVVPGPGGRRRGGRHGAAVAAAAGLRRGPGAVRGLGEGEPRTTGSPTTAAGSSSSCRRCSASRTRPSSGRTASAGAWRPTRRPCSHRRRDRGPTDAEAEEVCRAVRCPVLVVHGERDDDRAVRDRRPGGRVDRRHARHRAGRRPRHADARPGAVHAARSGSSSSRSPGPRPGAAAGPRPAAGAAGRCSSPRAIGLGHALRDVAIADELRALHPDLEIDWLAQHPVTRVLADRGERVHPASRFLASESAHIESEAGEHDLHAFQAIRRMDEILAANFHVFHDVVEDEQHDLVVADEGWEIDHFLHENPELKRTAYAWLTDFVGWLPMPDGGPREAALTADYNAEMVEQIARYPRLRDRSIFVGDPDDLVTDPLGPGCRPCATGPGRTSPSPATSPGSPRSTATTARAELGFAAGRARLRGGGRRVRRRRPAAAARRRGAPVRGEARAGPADGRRHRSADRPGDGAGAARASRSGATCPACTGCSPPATSRSSRAG